MPKTLGGAALLRGVDSVACLSPTIVSTGEWRTVTQAFSALDNSEPPVLTEFAVGERIQVRMSDDAYVRFSREPDREQEFYAPKHWFLQVTALKPRRRRKG